MILKRVQNTEFGMFGVIMDGNIPFALTLERPWLNNANDISCIPAGKYTCERFHSETHPNTFQITNVKGRTGILFHTGNLVSASAGCVLVGEQYELYKGQPAILSSKKGFSEFMKKLENETSFEILIIDP